MSGGVVCEIKGGRDLTVIPCMDCCLGAVKHENPTVFVARQQGREVAACDMGANKGALGRYCVTVTFNSGREEALLSGQSFVGKVGHFEVVGGEAEVPEERCDDRLGLFAAVENFDREPCSPARVDENVCEWVD